MDIETQKLIEECAHDYVLDDYAATFGERLYLWKDWESLENEFNGTIKITNYPPDQGQPYTFSEVTDWGIQNSYIVEEDDEAQQYIVSVSLEKTEVTGDSIDEDKESKDTYYVTLHVFVEYENGKLIAECAEEQ
ncbi:hypothetical protein PN509_18180 [Nodularia spumigena CS-588/02]|uniref:hypothetical protein n=1 Tax=Nodularia spumigena TaxID=70799 RepID=UPI00232FA764|nr:hypothetical protein [Nodularia spumigena]MDB9362216.1 hypothetical protein [Nodularia spumigena CS-588/02]MDB9367185.1 hypothetical protein [Nodularia spumigena CS-588/02A10]